MLYRLIFDVIIPIRKTTKAVKQQFREAQERMNEQMNQNGYNPQPQPKAEPQKQEKIGDYIDFEELK
jgi:hypothetical protein